MKNQIAMHFSMLETTQPAQKTNKTDLFYKISLNCSLFNLKIKSSNKNITINFFDAESLLVLYYTTLFT